MIFNILIAYGAFQAFFIAFILLFSEKRSRFKKLFAFLLLIEGITLFERLLVETALIQEVPHLLFISYPISFLKPPIMLFMALAITKKGFKLKWKSYLHFLPFLGMLTLSFPMYLLSASEKLAQVQSFMENIPSYQDFEFYFSLSFFFYIGIYIYQALQQIQLFRQQILNNQLVNWYRTVLLIYSAFLVLHFLYFLVQPLIQSNFILINQMSMLAMTFIIQAIAFKLMNKSNLFNGKTPDLSDLQKRKADENLIVQGFESDKVYLDDTLNLQKYADSIALPAPYVSKIINQKFNCSFPKLLAQYRVQEAKKLLQNTNGEKTKLIDIAYQAGFSNKVSFYRAFKEFENCSPSQYLEKVKNT